MIPIIRMWQCVLITIVSSMIIAIEFCAIESPFIWEGNAHVIEAVREDHGIGLKMTTDTNLKFKANGALIENDWLKNRRSWYWCKVRLNGDSLCAVPIKPIP